MAIGERIRFIRNLRGMTQKYLGQKIGFSEKTADVRMAQYESGARTPKEQMTEDLARILDVSTHALTVPDIENYIGLAHTLFTLEDRYGFKISNIDGEFCITLDKNFKSSYFSLAEIFNAWHKEAEKFEQGEITKEQYDNWRYNYPRIEAERFRDDIKALREEKKINAVTTEMTAEAVNTAATKANEKA